MTVVSPPANPPAPVRRRLSLRWLVSGASVVALLLAWYLVTGPLELLSAVQLPSPVDAWDALLEIAGEGYADGTLLQHITSSTGLVLYGFAAAALTGVPLGILMGQSRLVEAYVNPVFQIVRPIAPIAWIPLTILWFGLGTSAKVFVIWLAAFAPTVINTYTGVRNIDDTLIQAARVNGAVGRRMLLDVIVPGALPAIFTGLRTSLQACWMVLVAAELVGSFIGLGHVLIIATRDLNSGMIVVAMAAVAGMGMLMSALLAQIERRVMPWKA
ncbi:ABC transporter permease [Achromobacter sp. SD115]|uniref:ABC transporter permease n=1 Tax=Achromobacter sp. SD115 TaxID=2782011 RepID=UPI001A95EE27|nr:ABC transporter permease [Achromobacter sp. SD115]MBO1014985.1 ABC transporter permease [Achromobacter sp. SD115]